MAQSELAQVIEEYHRTIDAIVTGDPEPQKRLWSRGDDVTLANPLGPPVRGWEQVKEHLEQAASTAREGEPLRYESISVSTTLESDAVATLEDEATGLVSSLPGSVCGCWGGCRWRGLVVGSWRL
jgi:hypothetical protein